MRHHPRSVSGRAPDGRLFAPHPATPLRAGRMPAASDGEKPRVESPYRTLPALHRLLDEPQIAAFAAVLGAPSVKSSVTAELDGAREQIATGGAPPSHAALVERITQRLRRAENGALVPVLNATGVLLHTNFGRAPLAADALRAMADVGGGYSNLEYDLAGGHRGSRYDRVVDALREATGAADGLVVNNCAAAILLLLDAYGRGRDVIVARNELIEIGGGFRLPDVLARSGARLVEVGTTNKVRIADVERALTPDTTLLLRSHRSNFRLSGFVEFVEPRALAQLGRRTGITTVEDVGSGALVDLSAYGLPRERTVPDAVADGFDAVAFSGDKLLGGPQAGIIVGAAATIARLRTSPLLRALRVDKSTLAALEVTLRLTRTAADRLRIPLFAMLSATVPELRARAARVCDALGNDCAASVEAVACSGAVGGGTLPDVALPSAGLTVAPRAMTVDALAARLRSQQPALIGRIADDRLVLDLRTIDPARDADVASLVRAALAA